MQAYKAGSGRAHDSSRHKAHFQIANVFDWLSDVLSQKIGDLVTEFCLIKKQSAGVILVFVLND
jgi:hypothetical protein